jgi:8-oxo-dGTP pyrophosphatase MutT (NUDIX family)
MYNKIMKQLWQWLGNVAFWVSWPGSWLYLRVGKRTRVLVVAEGEVLVVKPWLGSGRWILPGGGLHRREDPLAGALRELREETGLMLEPSNLKQMYEGRFRQFGFRFTYTAFVAEVPHKPATQRQFLELTDVAWLAPEGLTAQNAAMDVTQALAAWRGLQGNGILSDDWRDSIH